MSTEEIGRLFQGLEENPELARELEDAPDVSAFVAVATRHGYEFTGEDLRTSLAPEEHEGELSEDQLLPEVLATDPNRPRSDGLAGERREKDRQRSHQGGDSRTTSLPSFLGVQGPPDRADREVDEQSEQSRGDGPQEKELRVEKC